MDIWNASELLALLLDALTLFRIADRPVVRHFKLNPPLDIELGVSDWLRSDREGERGQ